MNITNIKTELLKVYCTRLPDFQRIQDVCKYDNTGIQINGPLLMSPNENYAKQLFPLLVIGQETKSWHSFSTDASEAGCVELMADYESFNVGEKYYASPFWNMTRKIENALGNEPCSCAWTNISKYDQNGKKPDAEHSAIFSAVDNLLIDEINIMKPKICLFFTSYKFDYRLKNIFEQIEFIEAGDGFEAKALCRLKHPNLPALSFRTYHPQYLRRSGKEEAVIDFIRKQTGKL
jgi:hypothetical protein